MFSVKLCTASTPTARSPRLWPRLPRPAAYRARQVALAWLLQKDGITAPIVGASKFNHLDDAVAALSLKLTAEEIAKWKRLMCRIRSLVSNKGV